MARKRIDLTGQRFGRLVVISYNEEVSKQKKSSHWNCKCECGNEVVVWVNSLRKGVTISCGCYHSEKMKKMWQDEEFRQMQSNKMKKQNEKMWEDEEFRRMKSDEMKELNEKQWQNEEFRQMQSNKKKKQNEEMWKDEEMKWKMHYKGGISTIKKYLGTLPVVVQWLNDCKKQAKYTCELTGKVGGSLHTHHLKAFSTIVSEAHELYNIQVKPQVKDYTEEELHKLEEYVASWHKDNSNAVVLCKEAHDLFHRAKNKGGYGKGGNTPEQYEEFKQRYLNGEFEGLI